MTERAAVAPALFALLGVAMLVAGAAICWGLGGALIVAGVLSVAVGVDLARSPRTPAPGTDFPTGDEVSQ